MIKIGIFFGGQSREREISFAGGRTVYDNLNKDLFEAVPVFVDSLGNFILLDWEFIYKGTIRDFYPPASALDLKNAEFQLYIESLSKDLSPDDLHALIAKVGKKISPEQFASSFDFAFLALHGPYGEDGNIQGILEWYGIPYSGAGILSSSIGINKLIQKELMKKVGFKSPLTLTIAKSRWLESANKPEAIFHEIIHQLGAPFVIKAPCQGSSIGVSIVHDIQNVATFSAALNKSFFLQEIKKSEWQQLSYEQKVNFIRTLTDIREGIGMPVTICGGALDGQVIYHPNELLQLLDSNRYGEQILLESIDSEEYVIVEQFIKGREFSCIVVQDDYGQAIALPPTEIVKQQTLFDYRSKYLPGMSRKVTPINLKNEWIENIKTECKRLFLALQFNVYARIDGFITEQGEVFLNDPNTTSGMLPSSFFFHQAAEIGLNPSQFLTYIIRTSLAARLQTGKKVAKIKQLLHTLDHNLAEMHSNPSAKVRVAVIMGGFSSERHISVESGRNIYEKLASSGKYEPFPVFLTGSESKHELYLMPINIMLKDNADDIREKVQSKDAPHPALLQIREEAESITKKYVLKQISKAQKLSYKELSELVDEVFIALHGRPGEDGAVQEQLEKFGLPYNGSGIESSRVTINKYETNEILAQHGVLVAQHTLIHEDAWLANATAEVERIERSFKYPVITKPADDGCSSAVKKIKNRAELEAFAALIFRKTTDLAPQHAQVLNLRPNEEFPQKRYFMVETLISSNGASHFLEVTGGMLTHTKNGVRQYEVFEPSETLASGEVLSLEEKFLAGEGQNITPARFSKNAENQQLISAQVRAELEKVARILNVEGYCRIDAFVRIFDDQRAETIIIEINSLPGMTPATCIFHQSAINGYKPYQFIDKILEYGKGKSSVLA